MSKIKSYILVSIIACIISFLALSGWGIYHDFFELKLEFKMSVHSINSTMAERGGLTFSDYDSHLVYAQFNSYKPINKYSYKTKWKTPTFYYKMTFLDKNIEMVECYASVESEMMKPFKRLFNDPDGDEFIDILGTRALYYNNADTMGGGQALAFLAPDKQGVVHFYRFNTVLRGEGKYAEMILLATDLLR